MSVLKNNVFRVISFFLMISCMIAESFSVLEIYAESGVNEPPVPTPAPTGR